MNDGMARAASVGLAVLAAGLMLLALYWMGRARYAYAGLTFLTASIVIYYRETALA